VPNYDRAGGWIILKNDQDNSTADWGTLQTSKNGNAVVGNSNNHQCTIDMSRSSVSFPDGTHLSLTLYITFISSSFTGQKNVYEVVTDHSGQTNANGPNGSPWLSVGTWNVGVPITVTSNPALLSLTVDTNTTCNPTPCTYLWFPGDSHTISAAAQGTAVTQYVNPMWSDGGAALHSITVPTSAATYTATFATQYYLTTSSSAGGTIQPGSGWHYSQELVTVSGTPTPNSGLIFSGFTGALTGTTNPKNLTMSAPATVMANFVAPVTVTTSPPGLSLTVDTNTTCNPTPCTYLWTPGSPPSHTINVATPTQSGGTGRQYVFANWSSLSSAASQTVAPTAATTYTANFNTQYLLTTAVSPSAGGTISPGGWYGPRASVTLTESSASGYAFAGFTNAGGVLSGSTVTISGPATVTANFVSFVTTLTSVPPGLSLTVDGGSCPTPCTFPWTPGTTQWAPNSTHNIAAPQPPQQGGVGTQYVFSNWSDQQAQSHPITIPSFPPTCTAGFTTQYLLTTSVYPVVPFGAGIISPVGGWHNSGDAVTVTATPSLGSGYIFSGFNGNLTGPNNQALMMNGPKTVTANFYYSNPIITSSS
jgi:hypothetical protein